MLDETSSRADALAFGLLGPLQASRDGVALQLGGRQQRAVLALLVAEADSTVSVDRLADALWGEHVPAGYVATLQTYVFHLREVLEPGRGRGAPGQVLLTRPGGYALRTSDGSVDAAEFERLAAAGQEALTHRDYATASALLGQALGLWRGQVLADLGGYDFVVPIAARLDELRLTVLEDRIDADLALGRHAALVAELDQLVDRHPLRERLHGQRMLALYRCGRQSDALSAYRELHQKLDDELGIEPSAPLRDLHRGILMQDDQLNWHAMSAQADTAHPNTGLGEPDAATRPRRRGRRWALAGSAVAALTAAGTIVAVIATHTPKPSLAALPANGVGAIYGDGTLHDAVSIDTGPAAIAYGAGSLWTADTSSNTVSRIDPHTHAVVPIPVGAQPNAITITGRDVWVVNSGDGTVTRINADSNTSTQTIPVGTLPDAIASGPRGIWVGNRGDDTIQYIDPTTGAPRPAISADGPPDGIALDGNTAWVTDTLDGTVSQVDTTTGDVIHGPIHTDAGASGIALTAHDVWVTNSLALSVTRIDRATGQVVGVIRVGDGPSSITAAGKYLWVGDQYDGTITRIDPTRGDDVRNYAIGSSPTGLAAIGDKVWVASGAFTSRSHIGGTLRVVSYFIPGDLGGIDPANVYVSLPLAAQRMVYDGLVSFRQASGQAGWTLVPDLATALPQPTDGGRSYTFTIRPGIRYSDGTTVIASDIRRGVLRELRSTLGNPSVFFGGIRGAATCIAHRQSCDTVLRTGIVVNDPGRITFHLTAPDPNFLYKLTYFAVATAPIAPATPPMVAAPLPATGPYMIKTYRQRKSSENPFQRTSEFTMVRNPYFHQWSFAAQPNGYPKVIDFQHVSSAAAAVKLVQDGAADVTLLPYAFTDQATNAHLVQDLRQRFGPARLHTVTVPDTDYPISLNTHIPPFNSRDARQAVNYTVDRNLLITLSSGPSPGVPSCQMLPPNFPGYRPYCPYTTGPADGPYRGPDLPRAQALIARSDTRDMAVTVWGYAGPNHPTNQYIARVLHQLGYRVTLRELPNNLNTGDAYLSDPAHRVQIAVIGHGWLPDYPSPSTYYDDMASCHDYSNHHMYCNPALDRLAGQATALQATDPAASRALWTHIDKTLTDEAPWVVSNNETWSTFTSSRVRNFQLAPQYNMPVFDQLWVE